MAEFLTPEWFDLVNTSHVDVDPTLDLVLDVVISDGAAYRVTARGGIVNVGPSSSDPADVTIAVDRDTAALLAAGQLTAHDAFLAARVRFSGDVSRLGAVAAAVAALSSALTTVRDATSY